MPASKDKVDLYSEALSDWRVNWGCLTASELYLFAKRVVAEAADIIQKPWRLLTVRPVREQEDPAEWSVVVQRYINLAKAAGIDNQHRKFAVERWINRKNGRDGTLTVKQWEKMLDLTGGRCVFCGENHYITMEHLFPRSMGGGFSAENIVPACRRCNQVRGTIMNISPELFIALEFERWYDAESNN